MSLREAWDREAGEWIAFARAPDADHAFWRMTLPALLALLPAPGIRTVDVGCGEGRVARRLSALGHHVVGIEGSPRLAAAAREADPAFEVHVADAARMPLQDASADLAVASLSLMNIEDLDGAVAEIARVLTPGGRLCFSVLHPSRTWRDAGGPYFATTDFDDELGTLTLHERHRPLGAYSGALADAGFVIERLVEPTPDDAHVAAHPDAAKWRTRPGFLHIRAARR